MNISNITLKTEHHAIFSDLGEINKVVCTLNPSNIAKLIKAIDLTANPRKSRKNKVTLAIQETLENTPEFMVFKSKGLLLSTSNCKPLERGRFQLKVEDNKTDGLLDGGHNMLAIGMYFLDKYFEINEISPSREFLKIKRWDDFKIVWDEYADVIDDIVASLNFLVPVEIIYPVEGKEAVFADRVFEISDARNNNYALTSGTKANHKGYYEILKNCLDPLLANQIEWKDGDLGKPIKREAVVALAIIPLIALQNKGLLKGDVNKINPTMIYNNKSKCIEFFTNFIESYVSDSGETEIPTVIQNAFKLMADIPRLYDQIYKKFPIIYNNNNGSFGRISSVKQKKDSDGVVIRDAYVTKYYNEPMGYSYPEAFIMPIIVSLAHLIDVKGDKVFWKIEDMSDFIEHDLTNHCEMLLSTIKDNNYEPQAVGKSSASYKGMQMQLEFAVLSKK